MKIAVTAAGADLDAPASPVFGRCPTYVFVDTETLDCEAQPNPTLSAAAGPASRPPSTSSAALFLRPTIEQSEEVGVLIPQVDDARCTFCGRCAQGRCAGPISSCSSPSRRPLACTTCGWRCRWPATSWGCQWASWSIETASVTPLAWTPAERARPRASPSCIPLDRRIAEAISDGVPLVEAWPAYRPRFVALYEQIAARVAAQREAA